jgi:crotonobetainyl-CoA:carnitine CoA-transferase CaiB-like acyl-CoA transferase
VAGRAKNVSEWFEVRGAPLTGKSTVEWLSIFQAADIAAMPCHTLETLRHDPHLTAVNFFIDDVHPTEGPTVAIRSALRVDGLFPPIGQPAQPKGWETRRILLEAGYDANAIDKLLSSRAAIEAAA